MKKIIALLTSAILAFSLTGCSSGSAQESADNAEKTKVVVGTSASYYPWAYQENDELKGFEMDVWNEIAARNNYELEFKLAKFSGLVGMLDAGEIDTIAHQMSITPERLEKYNFGDPYAYSYYDFAVKNDGPINTKEDLKGKKVGCWLGGNGEKTLRDANDKYSLGLDIVTFDGAPIEKEVELGRIDACWQGEIKTISTIKENNLPLRLIGERLTFEVNAYPFAKDEAGQKLANEVSMTINAMKEDGTLAQLSEKWFEMNTVDKPADAE
ncbi:MAG: transporter substrate-binding domain-containing protein [Proteocatella sp.]